MKTQLIHSFSTSSLTALSNNPSAKPVSSPRTQRKFEQRKRKLSNISLNNNITYSNESSIDSTFFDDSELNIPRCNTFGSDDGPNANNTNPPPPSSSNSSNNEKSHEGSGSCLSESFQLIFRKKTMKKRMPILEWLPKYTLGHLLADFIAGVTVGLTLLPQLLAYPSVSGLSPEYGLYSAFIGPFIYILFGSTKDVTIVPTGITAIITLSYTLDKPPQFAVLLAFINGVVTLLLGICQLGFIVNFISWPVFSAFISAASLTIIASQIKIILALKFNSNTFLDSVIKIFKNIGHSSTSDLILAIVSFVILLILQYLPRMTTSLTKRSKVAQKIIWYISVSRAALIVIAATTYIFLMDNRDNVQVFGHVPRGLPPFQLPPFEFTHNGTDYSIGDVLGEEGGSALVVVPFLALMEHITIAKYLASLEIRAHKVDASQEMIASGLANLVGSFFSSMPVTGSLSATTTANSAGSKTPMFGLFTGIVTIIALLVMTPTFYYIPRASLAAVVITGAMMKINFTILITIFNSKKYDLIPWGLTFFVSIFLGLEFGILVGILISFIFILFYVARPKVRVKRGEIHTGIEFILVELDRSLVFPSVDFTINAVLKAADVFATKAKTAIVMDCQHIQFADYTFARGLRDLCLLFERRKQPLILWKLQDSVLCTVIPVITGVPFRQCQTERELEILLEELEKLNMKERRKSGEVCIIVSPEEEVGSKSPAIVPSVSMNLQIPTNYRSPRNEVKEVNSEENHNYDEYMTCTTEPTWLAEARNDLMRRPN